MGSQPPKETPRSMVLGRGLSPETTTTPHPKVGCGNAKVRVGAAMVGTVSPMHAAKGAMHRGSSTKGHRSEMAAPMGKPLLQVKETRRHPQNLSHWLQPTNLPTPGGECGSGNGTVTHKLRWRNPPSPSSSAKHKSWRMKFPLCRKKSANFKLFWAMNIRRSMTEKRNWTLSLLAKKKINRSCHMSRNSEKSMGSAGLRCQAQEATGILGGIQT